MLEDVSTNRAIVSAALDDRLQLLTAALGALPEGGRGGINDYAAQLFANIDEFAGRVRAVAALLDEGHGSGWDLLDQLAAELLLRDLAGIARDLRRVAGSVSADLASAEDALREIARVLADATREMDADSAEAGTTQGGT